MGLISVAQVLDSDVEEPLLLGDLLDHGQPEEQGHNIVQETWDLIT